MGSPKKVAIIFGTRPEAIKVIPVILELAKYSREIKPVVIATAQHRDMLDEVLKLFEVKPDFDLNIMEENQSLSRVLGRALSRLDKTIEKIRPDLVLVQGDTTTTLTAALSAYYHQIPVGHLEAGLRTYDKYNPYPEEINRRMVSVLSDLHFAPTVTSKENLLREGIRDEKIFITGNTVIDALFAVKGMDKDEGTDHRLILVTAHRRENWGRPLENICSALKELICLYEDIQIVYPVHPNPNVSGAVKKFLDGVKRIHLLPPLSYQSFVRLMERSYLILTDSGGIQEEAPSLGKPVLVLRKITERPEALEAGTVRVVGTEKEEIVSEVALLLDNKDEYEKMAKAVNPYGDGLARQRVVGAIRYYLGLTDKRPEEFKPRKIGHGDPEITEKKR